MIGSVPVGAIDAAALGPFEKKSSLFWLQFFWLVQFQENHENCCQYLTKS